MGKRSDLQLALEAVMRRSYPSIFPDPSGQSRFHVYFRNPGSTKMQYPAILYHLDREYAAHANNHSYTRIKRYRVTIMDRNPDSPIPDILAELPMTGFLAANDLDGLHHTIYSIYF